MIRSGTIRNLKFFDLPHRLIGKVRSGAITAILSPIFLLGSAAAFAQDADDAAGVEKAEEYDAPARDVEEWIERWGDRWTERYHPDVDEQYPGGRSDRFHGQYVAEALKQRPDLATDDWRIFNKDYIYDGDWFIVEWLYQSRHVATGRIQRESTVAFGKIEDDRLRIWIEYFDDMVGHYQWIGAMPLFGMDEEPYPWPKDTPLRRAYRP